MHLSDNKWISYRSKEGFLRGNIKKKGLGLLGGKKKERKLIKVEKRK